MASDKSIQPSQGKRASDPDVEIITPLKVHNRDPQPEASRFKRPVVTTGLLLLIGLTALAIGGLLFIRHVSKHAAYMANGTHQTSQLNTDPRSKSMPDTPETLKRQTDPLTTPVPLETDAHRKPAPDAAKTPKRQAAPLTIPAPIPLEQPQTTTPQQTIDPADPAKRARERENATRLEAANRLIGSGKGHEKNNRLAFALADYQKALEFDPESRTAENALNRVKEQIATRQFQKLMSDGLTAYHNDKYQDAREKLLKANSLRPDSREVQEALVQVDEAIRLDTIGTLHRKASSAEQAEDWEQAFKSYLAVLKIDPNISFALLGKERSLEHIRITKRISFFLNKPEAMESKQQLQNAVQVIEAAETLQIKGTRLNARLGELKLLVDTYRTPLEVTIDSDNLTKVSIYKVGRLGQFTSRKLTLKPGRYTVVGSRDGYKDVRRNITVKPAQKAMRITVICKHKVSY
jgi:tetratricopeptide (TPR) repeat protein